MDKHMWKDSDIELLIGFMEELVDEGLRADNGQFKPGAYNKLAAKMNDKIPGAAITEKHCKHKVKRLKDKFQFANDMLKCSGFGWDETNQCVVVDSKDVLTNYLKQHGTSYYTPGKPFPFYARLERIFGKDRADGTYAETGVDMDEQLAVEKELGLEEDELECQYETQSPLGGATSTSTTARQLKAKKSKLNSDDKMIDKLANSFLIATEQTCKSMNALGDAIKGNNEGTDVVLATLGFNEQDIVLGAMKLAENPLMEKTFWSLTMEQRGNFVKELLKK